MDHEGRFTLTHEESAEESTFKKRRQTEKISTPAIQPTTGQQSEKASTGLKSTATPLKLLDLGNDKNETKYDETERLKIY